MWRSHIFDGLSSIFRRPALIDSRRDADAIDSDFELLPGRLPEGDLEQHEVDTGNGMARIFVTRRTMVSSFDEEAEYSPIIVSSPVEVARPSPRRTVIDTPIGVSPADLFINATRKDPRTIFNDAEPIIIRKKSVASVPDNEDSVVSVSVDGPIVQIAEQPIVQAPSLEEDVQKDEPVISTPNSVPPITIAEPEIVPIETVGETIKDEGVSAEPVVEEGIPENDTEVITTVMPESQAFCPLSVPSKGMLALPPRLELKMLPAPPSDVGTSAGETVVITPSLPAKIEIEDSKPQDVKETQIVEFANSAIAPIEATATSAEAMNAPIHSDLLLDEVDGISEIFEVNDLDRDVLFAFVPGLAKEAEEFMYTSLDSYSELPEDELDRTEGAFKLKTHRKYPVFDGYMRHIANH